MSWFRLHYWDLHPHATFSRWPAGWHEYLERALRRVRGLTSSARTHEHAFVAALERGLGRVRPDPELASCVFFLILIALTFFI
jgi:hypothetical protein